ncbi:hypothetical protein VAR608DRAFT_2967 [Variovorax sp. HW608]|uniref:hypothetical protein n=1 Tax=Variovorax sp. HW608 TaxID=1034889 RepID=UPI0008201F79|nr:hypothetical protein [Variovorax sp. HW608]SCK33494.1 hypothetical protein VAR608DRAFT_2967 [Variovorax sp. HW608]
MRALAAACVAAGIGGAGHATPRVPANDDVIVESLPSVAGWTAEERRLRRELALRPRDEATAIAAAQDYLEIARSQGDARYAGYALGALQAWDAASPDTPPGVLVMRATVMQFLHDFAGAEAALKTALARQPGNAQAWITLATIARVRGRYLESDVACRALGRVGAALYGVACLAENAGLRGDHDGARTALNALLADPAVQGTAQAGTRQWLLTTLAEVEELAGRASEAEAAYRQAIQAKPSGYVLLAYSDFLQRTGRPDRIAALLGHEARSDAVLLRLAIAARSAAGNAEGASQQLPSARTYSDELQARFESAALRPGATVPHAREEALFALDVKGDARRALELARLDVELQREPIDLLLFARAAVAANDDEARRQVKRLMQQTGLKDARVDAVL